MLNLCLQELNLVRLKLVIEKNAIGTEGIECLSKVVSKYSKLRGFEFHDLMSDHSVSLKSLGQSLSTCQELTEFKFYCNNTDSIHISDLLLGILKCNKLCDIRIFNISDSAEVIPQLSQILNNNLETLWFLQLEFASGTKISDDQIKLFSDSIAQCTILYSLILRQFDMSASGITYMQEALSKIDWKM